MTEREIRYCTTPDKVRIAYCTIGAGYPLLVPTWTYESLATRFDYPFVPALLDPLARGRQLILWDPRNIGLSQHGVRASDAPLEDLVLDVDGVLAALGIERCAIFATVLGGTTAVAVAALRPDLVSHLVLYDTWITVEHVMSRAQLHLLAQLGRTNWEMASQAVADTAVREDPEAGRLAPQVARGFRAAMSSDEFATMLESAADEGDAAWRLVESVAADALIVHHVGHRLTPFTVAQETAARVPRARLVALEGDIAWSGLADLAAVMHVVDPFIPSSEPPQQQVRGDQQRSATTVSPGGTAIILFADIADSTALTERIGDAPFRAKARELDVAMRERVRANGGSVIDAKTLGDGILATFSAASQAIAAALSFEEAARATGLALHVGVHAGDVIREQDNVFGGAVNIAARISALSVPGEVLVSDVVRALARTSAGVTFEDRGEHELKGVSEPQRVFVVRKQT